MIEILTSVVALGHMPGPLLASWPRERGVVIELSILERLPPDRVLTTTR